VQDWDGQINRSQLLVRLINILPRLSGERTSDVQSLVAILLGALPLMVASVCFSTTGNTRRLNGFGGVMVLVLSVALVLAVVGYLGIDPKWKDGHVLGLDGLVHAQQWARTVISVCVFYLAALLGIKASHGT
jgi:purine-cytosine permease-like protein